MPIPTACLDLLSKPLDPDGSMNARLAAAAQLVDEALAQGSIANVRYQTAKATFGNLCHNAWDEVVSKPYFWTKDADTPPSRALRDMYFDLNVWSLREVLTAQKKIERAAAHAPALASEPGFVAMKAFCETLAPLAHQFEELKEHIVKGRVARETPVPVNPNRVEKTCSCCFRAIAVMKTGLMASHGYRRPGVGFQTAGCPGSKFRPIEESTEGLVWYIASLRGRLEVVHDDLRKTQTHPESYPKTLWVKTRAGFGISKQEEIDRTDPRWAKAFAAHQGALRMEILGLETSLPELDQRLIQYDERLARKVEPGIDQTVRVCQRPRGA